MATHAIGKLRFKLSKDGLDYRWGDGEIKRLFGGRKQSADEDIIEENDAMDGADGYDDPGYDDGYDDRDGDGYADDPGYDDGYADDPGYDDGYDDRDAGYDDDGYDDRYDDDAGYDDNGYDDDGDGGYYDDGDDYAPEGEYDDRYSDEDAGENYDDGYYPAEESPLMQYVDENDWVTYLLLFLFPPLGIYLLWRRNKFDKPVRIAVTAASAIWFVVALILIFSAIFGGAQDATQDATITLAPTSTVTTLDFGNNDGDAGLDLTVDNVGGTTTDDTSSEGTTGGDEALEPEATPLTDGTTTGITADGTAEVEPSPTPLVDAASAALSASAYVYSPATGLYYHSSATCTNIDEGVSVSRVPKEVAENNRKQSACPVCIGAATGGDTTTYWATQTGQYYHTDQNCQGMTGATSITKEAAELRGKTACPVCVTGEQKSTKEGDVIFITSSTTDKSKISVYTTSGGKYYHMTANCSGMSGATRGSLKDALLAGKGACPTCCKAAGTTVYCTKNGKSYHLDKTCSGMTGAAGVTLAEAMVMGKSRCTVCVKSGALPTASQLQQAAEAGDDGTYVYGTANGKYYHTDPNCSGMKDAQRYTLKSMLLQNREACPKCASDADTVVYCTKSGKYYHSYATCSGMTTATSGTMAEAISQGYKRCPRCWSETTSMAKARAKIDETALTAAADSSSSSSSSGKTTSGGSSSSSSSSSSSKSSSSASSNTGTTTISAKATAKNTYVYATREGSYYHLKNGCSGMKGASRITLKQAINAGKKACPTCASAANRTVYSTSGGDHYHSAPVCTKSGLKNGEKRTLAQALMLGQTACSYCIGKNASSASTASASTVASIEAAKAKLVNSHTYTSGKSGIYVYARADGKYYHRVSDCSGMTNAGRVTLETAMNYGKTACPKCCASARRTVYATRGGKYYHNSKTHAGTGAKSGSLASALAYGYKACPYCVTKTKTLTSTNTYKSGTSGIKVYATVSGSYYHSKSDCSGLENPSHITLETALNYGKKPCPKCMKTASMKVYSSSGDKYYHYYKLHASSNAKSGTLAVARALGKKMCSTCAKLYNSGISASDLSDGNLSKSDIKEISKLVEEAGVTAKSTSYSKAPVSTDKYSASGDTKVYVDLDGDYYFYYHKSSRCSDTKMKSGTSITLQYAKDWGYKACPYCNPPTSVSD